VFQRDSEAEGPTEQQQRFAGEHGAILGGRAAMFGRPVFVYRDEGWRTCRWLVDAGGEVVDFVSLHRPVPRASGRFVRADSTPDRAPLAD
jgi:hypothetical protein